LIINTRLRNVNIVGKNELLRAQCGLHASLSDSVPQNKTKLNCLTVSFLRAPAQESQHNAECRNSNTSQARITN